MTCTRSNEDCCLGPIWVLCCRNRRWWSFLGRNIWFSSQISYFFSFIFWWCFFILFCFLNKPRHQAPVAFQFFFNPLVKCSGEETKCIARNAALTWKVQCSPPELTSEGRSGKTMSLFVSEVRVGIKVENAWDPSVEVSPSLSGEPRQILLPGSWCLHSSKHLEER